MTWGKLFEGDLLQLAEVFPDPINSTDMFERWGNTSSANIESDNGYSARKHTISKDPFVDISSETT